MQSSGATASPAAAHPSLAAESDLERKPTWKHINFDDGFDLNLGEISSLNQIVGLPATSLTQPSRSDTAPDNTATTTSTPLTRTIPTYPDAASAGSDIKRASLSPASSNKALPQLPSISNSALNSTSATPLHRRQPSGDALANTILPASTSFASTVHARAPTPQDGTTIQKPPGAPATPGTPGTPGTHPQMYPHASPIITAATPEQPQHPDPSATPVARSAMHQPSRSQSSNALAWDPSQVKASRPVSSADAYMKPVETLQQSETSSRPGTAMSQLSGSNWMHDNRSSFGTTASAPMNQRKRASVLSFQTANSAGFTSGDEARASDREDLADDAFVAPEFGAVNMAPAQPNRPWLDPGYSGYGSSPDERPFPGDMPGAFWDEPSYQQPARSAPPAPFRPQAQTNPIAMAVPAQARSPASRTGAPAQDGSANMASGAVKDREPRDVRDAAAANDPEPTLAPINTQGLAPASSNAPLSSTTIIAPSDETTQAMRRSPDAARESRAPLAFPSINAPPPPATDLRVAEPIAPRSAADSPRHGANATPLEAASPPPADNVIPPPLPTEAAQSQPPLATNMLMNGPADHKPVSDYRKKPLADISPAQKAAGLAHLHAQAKAAKNAHVEMHTNAPPTSPPTEAPPIPILERDRRKSNASLTANVAMAQAAASPGPPRDDLVDRPDTPSAESASQESSAPPDGEVEARAEWERRRRMKRKNGKKQYEPAKPKGRSDTFKNQLKPLQLVPADNLNNFGDRKGLPDAASNVGARRNGDRHSVVVGDRAANVIAPVSADSRQTYSTQQLQRLQAREQRRSVGAFSAAMAAANVVSNGSNGPYPVFASPNSGPQKGGSRQYPGLMAQRSLVPPFELQHRPDGLPSGLIGPDGVRRSLNDPEVCLECMMRDEDMIDIRVVGEGVWERESDKDFEEAVRLEAEEAANGNGVHGPSGSGGHGDSISSHRDSHGSRRPRKKIGRGEPLTVDRLKLHTQMNPPASSFRWRTLQTFLAVQAKYIAMEQQRMRLEAEKKTRNNTDSISSRGSIVGIDSSVSPAERGLSSPFAPPREASVASRQSKLQASDDSELTPQQRAEKERDVAQAQAARKKMTAPAIASTAALTPPLGLPAYPTTPLQTRTPALAIPARTETDPEELLAGPPAAGGILTPNSGRRVPFGAAQAARAASVQDLRSAADRSTSAAYPASPSDSLRPPSRSFMSTSPTGTPSRLGARSGASQLSLMHSGSMIDMHVAQEDRAEHRINQNGFLPGTPLAVESPSTINRSYYGFPGDGDSSLPDAAAFERSRMVSGDGYVDPMEAGPRGLDLDRDDSTKRKKKGFRGLLSKLTGSSGVPSRENSGGAGATRSINGSIASRNASKRSQGSGSPRLRQNSISADRSLDATSPALNGTLSKAGKSTSSFFKNGVEPDTESRPRPQPNTSSSIFQNPPGMASQNSLDLGPFQPASPQTNTFSSTSGRIVQQQQMTNLASDPARMRKASTPLMQKYLNSPSPQTQASSGSSPNLMSQAGQNGRTSGFVGARDVRTSALQTIPDGDPRIDDNDPRKSVRLSGTSASLRKELPLMSPLASGMPEHQRNASSGTGGVRSPAADSIGTPSLAPAPAIGRPGDFAQRASMQASQNCDLPGGQAPPINTDAAGYGTIPDDASVTSVGPLRPPKNPRRPDGALNSSSVVDLSSGPRDQIRRDFAQPAQQYSNALYGSPETIEKKKSSIFRNPFGRKKRESTIGGDTSKPSIVIAGTDGLSPQQEAQPGERSTSGSFLPKLRGRKSYAGLGVPKQSFTLERQRVLSSPAHDFGAAAPPRSQSAFGMAPTQRFVSMDIPRRSMNVNRGNNRLSTMGYGEDDEEEDDDEMEREPGYEAEFARYSQEAMEERHLGTSSKGNRDVSFGRKSLNLLREGFKMPMRQASGGKR